MREYVLSDGRRVCVAPELGAWTAWSEGQSQASVHGFPLDGVLMEVLGLDPTHHDVPAEVAELARVITADAKHGAATA